MAQLLVRRLDNSLIRHLKERAARAGISTEEEHRRILRSALTPPGRPSSFKDHLLAIPAGTFPHRRRTTRRRTLDLR